KVGCLVTTTADVDEALALVRAREFDVLIADLKMPQMDGIKLLKTARQTDPDLAVVVITGYPTVDTAVEALKAGAFDYIPKPFDPDQLRQVVRNTAEKLDLLRENHALKEKLRHPGAFKEILGESEPIQQVRDVITKVAPTDSKVLILGDTGTGKELVARAIHALSHRAAKPFIPVNCASIPSTLLESELFGHTKGAFTGAHRSRRGCFQLAHGGTLFLDEIGEMGLDMQIKILRALQERRVQPVGSEGCIEVDVRIVAASNKDLEKAVQEGRFREDLFYRINVLPIVLPPLKDRSKDVLLLADHFLDRYRRELRKPVRGFTEEARQLLLEYPWPGNIRELENTVERAVILAEDDLLGVEAFPQLLSSSWAKTSRPSAGSELTDYPPLEKVERDYILEVLQATRWNRKRASEVLGISTVTIWRKLEKKG
ncbi:MAG: sigma-54-dependent transcriptional regulator, partial [Acidobacteriota bacterium]